jgi:hypothetical protein
MLVKYVHVYITFAVKNYTCYILHWSEKLYRDIYAAIPLLFIKIKPAVKHIYFGEMGIYYVLNSVKTKFS